jgi:rhodanese-related sulfurtransferase
MALALAAPTAHFTRMPWIWVLATGGAGAVAAALMKLRGTGLAPAHEVRLYLSRKALLLDVRTAKEHHRGHLPGSINVPLESLAEQIGERVPNKQQPLLVHSSSGKRSREGQCLLERLGYTKVFNLGGYRRAAHVIREASSSS